MQKHTYFIFSFVLFCASIEAQNNTFSKVWDEFIPINYQPIEFQDGSFMSISGLSTAINYTRLGLVRFNSNGDYQTHNWLWENQQASRNLNNILKLSNNSFISIGEHNYQHLIFRELWFTKWNLDLDTVFTKSYYLDSTKQSTRSNILDFNKSVLVSVTTSPNQNSLLSNGSLVKFDTLGNILWRKSYFTQLFNKRFDFWKILVPNPDEYILMGASEDSTENSGVFLMKTDTGGNNIGEFSYRFPMDFSFPGLLYTSYPYDAIHLEDGSILVAGATPRNIPGTNGLKYNKFLLKVSNDLELIWANRFESDSNISTYITKMAYLNNKIYGLVNTSSFDGTNIISRIGIACFDEDGNKLWEKLSQPTQDYFSNIIATNDNSILVTGVFEANQLSRKTWVLKFDDFGCIESNCDFLGFEETKFNTQFKIFPNPATQSFQIQWSEPIISDVFVTLIDAMGKVIFKTTINQNYGSPEIDISNFSSGVYFVQLSNKNQILGHQKLIKQ